MRARILRGAVAATSGAVILAGLAGVTPAAAGDSTSPAPASALRASALMNWYISPSLGALRSEINRRWPGRDRSSDGWIGDLRHQGRSNSHNPVGHPGGPSAGTRGAVHALDVTARGIDVDAVLSAVIGDSRVWYVIYDGRIWSRTYGWAARVHPGDPHSTHIHINLREDSQSAAVAAERDTSRWIGSSGSVRTVSRGTSARTTRTPSAKGLSRTDTKVLQRSLIRKGYRIPSGPTGWYGPETTAAVRAFQRAQGWSGPAADGLAGPETLRRLGVGGAASTRVTASPSKRTAKASSKSTTKSSSSGSLSAYKPGTASREVYFMQQALIKRGYAIPAGPTGYFGSKTVEAVKAFQRAQGWSAAACDGIPGRTTLRLLGL